MARAPDHVRRALADLREALHGAGEHVAAMMSAGVEAGQARSLEILALGVEVALANFEELETTARKSDATRAAELARDMASHISKEVARPQILDDLTKVVGEAQEDLQGRVGRHRNPVKEFIARGQALPRAIVSTSSAAARLAVAVAAWAGPEDRKERTMPDHNLKAIETAIRQVGRQLSFLSSGGAAGVGTSRGAGEFRTVTAQMTATLDALGMPHHGVQFATERNRGMALDTLIESLRAEFQEERRNGNPVYVLGEGARRAVNATDGRLLAGAAKAAARRVRAEADNILDILDRLPDLNRFRVEPGGLSTTDARNEVAERFLDLDEVLAEPFGVNIPRAFHTMRRVLKGLLDYFDYANLEPEFLAVWADLDVPENVPNFLLPARDPEELSKRRSPSVSEEIMYELRELLQAYFEIAEDVSAPVLNRLGNAASKLELYLTTCHASARDYRDLLVRFGTSLPEQDILAFTAQARATVAREGSRGIGSYELTVDQLMDWIVDVAEPFVGADFRSNVRERESLLILASELSAQSDAVTSLMASGEELGFAVSLYGPIRQLEELAYYLDRAREQADILAGSDHGVRLRTETEEVES